MSAELPPGVGTVGEELSKLLAVLSSRQGASGPTAEAGEEAAVPPAQEESAPKPSAPDASGPSVDGPPASEPGPTPEPGSTPTAEDIDPPASACTCGCHGGTVPMGQAQACSLCPLCQGIATLRALNPELLDRLAQLAALAADTLRELAADAAARSTSRTERPPPPRPARSGRVDIDVVDEPSGDAPGGDEAQG